MDNTFYKFSTVHDVTVYTQPKNAPSGNRLDWSEAGHGPGIFTISDDLFFGIQAQAIDDDQLKEIAEELKGAENLRYLYLAENRNITNKGMIYISELVQLQYLNISACDINSHGLSSLITLKNLTWLDISYCNRITENFAETIKRFRYLNYLNVQGVVKLNNNDIKKIEKRGLTIHIR